MSSGVASLTTSNIDGQKFKSVDHLVEMRIKILSAAKQTIICTSDDQILKSFPTTLGKFLGRVYEKDQCHVFTFTKTEVKCITIKSDLQRSEVNVVHKYSIRGNIQMCIANKEIVIFDDYGAKHQLLVLDQNNQVSQCTQIEGNFNDFSLVKYENRQIILAGKNELR